MSRDLSREAAIEEEEAVDKAPPAAAPRSDFDTALTDTIRGLSSSHTLIKDINFVEEGLGKTWLAIRLKLVHLGYRTFGGFPEGPRGPSSEDAYREVMFDLVGYFKSIMAVVHGEEGLKMAQVRLHAIEDEERPDRIHDLTAYVEIEHKRIGLSFRTAVQPTDWDWDIAEADRAMLTLQETTQKGREVLQVVKR